jgi:hypothetical protein
MKLAGTTALVGALLVVAADRHEPTALSRRRITRSGGETGRPAVPDGGEAAARAVIVRPDRSGIAVGPASAGASATNSAAPHRRSAAPQSQGQAASVRPGPADKTVRFSSPFADPGTRISGLEGCGPAQPGLCSLTFHGSAGRFTGALSTVADYHGHGYYDPIRMSLEAESWDHHVGSLSGCGSGSFVMHQTDFSGGPTTLDTGERAERVTLRWQIIEASGTGAFAGATGSGTGVVYFNSAGFTDNEPYLPNYGTYTGTITCPAGR